jgi:uncharacterized membrane protein YdjX (TVP38/TMEM64 family)
MSDATGPGSSPGFLRIALASPSGLRRIALLVGLLGVAGLLSRSEVVHRELTDALELIGSIMEDHSFLGAVVFVLVSALSAMLMFFSSVVLVPIGIQLWGHLGCMLLLWLGWFIGGVITYSIGRHVGRPVVERMLSHNAMASYEGRIPRQTSFMAAFAVQLALPSDVVGYFFGLMHFPMRTYLLALGSAELLYAAGTVFLGAAFLQGQYWLLLGGAAVAVVVLLWQLRTRSRNPQP